MDGRAFVPLVLFHFSSPSIPPFSYLRQGASPRIISAPVPALPEVPPFMPANSSKPDEPSFEDAMERLEEIVSAMEGERMPLEDMVQSYAEGARLLKQCRQRIDAARQRVELITADLEGTGKATLSTFDEATAEAVAESSAKPRGANTRRTPAKPAPDDAGDDEIRLF